MRKINDDTKLNLSEIPEHHVRKVSDMLSIHSETGHSHTLEASVYEGSNYYNTDHTTYVVLEKPTELKHEQHNIINVMPGTYMVDHVRDYVRKNTYD